LSDAFNDVAPNVPSDPPELDPTAYTPPDVGTSANSPADTPDRAAGAAGRGARACARDTLNVARDGTTDATPAASSTDPAPDGDDAAAPDADAEGAEDVVGSAVTTAVSIFDTGSTVEATGVPTRHAGNDGVVNAQAGYRYNANRDAKSPPNAPATDDTSTRTATDPAPDPPSARITWNPSHRPPNLFTVAGSTVDTSTAPATPTPAVPAPAVEPADEDAAGAEAAGWGGTVPVAAFFGFAADPFVGYHTGVRPCCDDVPADADARGAACFAAPDPAPEAGAAFGLAVSSFTSPVNPDGGAAVRANTFDPASGAATATGRPPARAKAEPAFTPTADPAAGGWTCTFGARRTGVTAGRLRADTPAGPATRDDPPDSAANTTPPLEPEAADADGTPTTPTANADTVTTDVIHTNGDPTRRNTRSGVREGHALVQGSARHTILRPPLTKAGHTTVNNRKRSMTRRRAITVNTRPTPEQARQKTTPTSGRKVVNDTNPCTDHPESRIPDHHTMQHSGRITPEALMLQSPTQSPPFTSTSPRRQPQAHPA